MVAILGIWGAGPGADNATRAQPTAIGTTEGSWGRQGRGAQGQEQKMRPLRSLQPLESFWAAIFGGLPSITPMVVGCARVAFSALGPAPLAPQAARNDSNGCRLRRGCIFCSWPCALRLGATAAQNDSRHCAPSPWRPRLPKMAAQHYPNGCRLRRGHIFCSWPCAQRA